MFRTLTTAAVAAAALAVPLAGAATSASASTPGCSATALCGSQQVTPVNRNALMMAVTNKPGIGSKVVVKLAGTTNAAEDFLQYNPPVTSDNAKEFAVAPKGVRLTGKGYRGGLCVTFTSTAVRTPLTLQPCTNAADQQFIAQQDTDGNFYWRARGTSYVLTDPNGGPVGTQLQLRNYWDGSNQLWTYVAAPAS